jgi:cytochrome b6-f complex iron-sulfur subunit
MPPSQTPGLDLPSPDQQHDSAQPRSLLRRTFGSLFGWGMTALGTTCGLWTLGAARFMIPNALPEPPHRFRAGRPESYARGVVEARFKETHGVWIVHGQYRGQWQIFALRATCTHLGCITLWLPDQQRFKCPCHGSGFSPSGLNVEGPAPRPLERYAIRLTADGQLEIDRSRVFREELGQWSDPDSFVA